MLIIWALICNINGLYIDTVCIIIIHDFIKNEIFRTIYDDLIICINGLK